MDTLTLAPASTANSRRTAAITRLWIKRAHLWLGLITGTHLLLMGLSGSALVFREPWTAAIEPAAATREDRVPINALSAAISRTLDREFPAHKLRLLTLPEGQRPVRATLQKPGSKPITVYLHPATGATIAQSSAVLFPDWLADFHHNLLLGRTGRVINGVMAIVLLSLIASGVWLWITQKRPFPLRLKVRLSSRYRTNFDLHSAAGFWVAPLLAVMACTAVYFAWHPQVAKLIDAVTFSRPAAGAPRASTNPGTATLEEIITAASNALPEARISFVRFPEHRGDPVVVRMKHADELRSPGTSQVYLEPSTAAVVLRDRTSEQPLGTRIVRNLAPIHFGEFGGLPIRLVWLALGLAPGLLFITGFFIWRRKTT